MIRCVKRGKSGPAKHPKAGYGEAHPMVSSCWAQRTEQVPRERSSKRHPKQPFRRVHLPILFFPVQRVF